MAPLVAVLLVLFLASPASPTLAASAPSEFRTGEFIPTARRVQYHGTRSRWVDLASKHCPRFGSDGLLAIPLPAPIVPPTKHQRKHGDGAAADAPPLLHGTYKVQFAFDGERVLTPWLTVAREDLDVGSNKKKKKRRKKNGDDAIVVADVPVVDLVLARAGRELLGGGATRARVSRAPQDYVAAHGGLADEWRTTTTTTTTTNETEQQQHQKWPRTLPVRVRWAARPGADLAAGASTLLLASLLAALVGSVVSLAGHGSVLRELVEGAAAAGAEEAEEVLMGGGRGGGGGGIIGAGGSVQLATAAAVPSSSSAAAAAFQRPQQPFQYQYQQQQQQAPAPQQPRLQQQFQPQQQQQPAPSTFAAPAPQASSFPPQQQQQLQQQQPLPSIAPPPASFTPQQQYAYYQQMHSYQRQQQQQQQLGQQQLGQGQQAPSSFYSQQQQPAAPSSKAD